jgi:hypothetical protein
MKREITPSGRGGSTETASAIIASAIIDRYRVLERRRDLRLRQFTLITAFTVTDIQHATSIPGTARDRESPAWGGCVLIREGKRGKPRSTTSRSVQCLRAPAADLHHIDGDNVDYRTA